MPTVNDLKKYKEALFYLPQLEQVIKILTLVERGLNSYRYLLPVYKILAVIKSEKSILERNRENCRVIKANKGLKINN